MSFDNSFDYQDIYFGAGPELNYYDDLQIDFWKELPERPPLERDERNSRNIAIRENVDYSDRSIPYDRTSLIETFGDADDDTLVPWSERIQPRNNGNPIQPTENIPTLSFVFFKQDVRENHWF